MSSGSTLVGKQAALSKSLDKSGKALHLLLPDIDTSRSASADGLAVLREAMSHHFARVCARACYSAIVCFLTCSRPRLLLCHCLLHTMLTMHLSFRRSSICSETLTMMEVGRSQRRSFGRCCHC